MSLKSKNQKQFEEDVAFVSRIYQSSIESKDISERNTKNQTGPSASIDSKILSAAKKAAAKPHSQFLRSWSKWQYGGSIAASVVLVAFVFYLNQPFYSAPPLQSAPPFQSVKPATSTQPSDTAVLDRELSAQPEEGDLTPTLSRQEQAKEDMLKKQELRSVQQAQPSFKLPTDKAETSDRFADTTAVSNGLTDNAAAEVEIEAISVSASRLAKVTPLEDLEATPNSVVTNNDVGAGKASDIALSPQSIREIQAQNKALLTRLLTIKSSYESGQLNSAANSISSQLAQQDAFEYTSEYKQTQQQLFENLQKLKAESNKWELEKIYIDVLDKEQIKELSAMEKN